MKKVFNILLCAAALAGMAACSNNSDKWTLDARPGADFSGQKAVIEEASAGRWVPVDTFSFDAQGAYRGSWPRPAVPAIMRITAEKGGRIFFPVDSLETITILPGLRLEGSPSAVMMSRVDSIIAAGGDNAAMKRAIAQELLRDPASVGAYFTVSRTVGGRPLFDPAVRSDLRVIGAVANAYAEQRPADPRTPLLSRIWLDGKAAASTTPRDTIYAPSIGSFEITGHDASGRRASLQQTARGARLTVLNVAAAEANDWPAVNLALKQAAAMPGVKVFQVAVGTDEPAWREGARSLPWPSVWKTAFSADTILIQYNIGNLPATFLLDGDATVVERITDLRALPASISRRLSR